MAMRTGVGAAAGAVRGAAAIGRGAMAGNAAAGRLSAASTSGGSSAGGMPEWAQRMRRNQTMSHGVSTAAHAVRSSDHGGGSTSVSLSEDRK
jgi:type IV secretion system protein TrbL